MATHISKQVFESATFGAGVSQSTVPAALQPFGTTLEATEFSTLVGKTTGELFVTERNKYVDGQRTDEKEIIIHAAIQRNDEIIRIKVNQALRNEFVEKDGAYTLPAKTVSFRILKGERQNGGDWYAGMLTTVHSAKEKPVEKLVNVQNVPITVTEIANASA